MKVLMGCPFYPPFGKGGGGTSAKYIAENLASRGHQVRVITPGPVNEVHKDGDVEIIRVSTLNVYWNYFEEQKLWKKPIWHLLEIFNPRAYFRMREEIKKFGPDIFLTTSTENINISSWLAARLQNVPTAHYSNSFFLQCWKGSMFRNGKNCETQCWDCKGISALKRWQTRLVTGLTTQSTAMRKIQEEMHYFPNALKTVIPSMTPHARISLDPTPSRKKITIGFIGYHGRNKGIEVLAKAAQRLSDCHEVEFLIAGEGDEDYSNELKELFPSENTRFCGWVQPNDFYPNVDIIVVPSVWREPFGRVSIEALTYGVPAIVSRIGGLPETIVENETGMTFTCGDSQELAGLLESLMNNDDLFNRLKAGAAKNKNLFAYDEIGEQWEKFLLDTIELGYRIECKG